MLGKDSATVAIIMFSDFQCPYCGVFARDTLPEIERRYVDSGRVLLVFRHLPLVQIHPFAMKAGEAAECAGRQGKFWPMHDRLFGDQKHLDETSLRAFARQIDLDGAQFDVCLRGQATSEIQDDLAEAKTMAISGTPTFLIGSLERDGRVRIAERLTGALPAGRFQAVLDRLLAASTRS